MAVQIPIIKIKKITESLLALVKTNFDTLKAESREQESLLYQIIFGNESDNYDFYEQAQDVFLRKPTSPKRIEVNLQFNKSQNPIPNIWVREPAKQNGSYNHIGGMMDFPTEFSHIDPDTDETIKTYQDQMRDTKRAVYELVITSDNYLTTLMIGEVLYSLFLGAQDTLNEHFGTFNYSMKEMVLNNESVPYGLYAKVISIETQFENIVPRISEQEFVNTFNFIQTLYEK